MSEPFEVRVGQILRCVCEEPHYYIVDRRIGERWRLVEIFEPDDEDGYTRKYDSNGEELEEKVRPYDPSASDSEWQKMNHYRLVGSSPEVQPFPDAKPTKLAPISKYLREVKDARP